MGIINTVDNIWSRINKNGSIQEHTPELGHCWEWTGAKKKGYGYMRINHKEILIHRIVYELTNGKFNKQLFVLHKCDNRKCVNPDHLFLGTHKDNMQDMSSKGRGGANFKREQPFHKKLTNTDILVIRAKYNSGNYLQKDLAEEYKVSFQHISNIVRGLRRFKYV